MKQVAHRDAATSAVVKIIPVAGGYPNHVKRNIVDHECQEFIGHAKKIRRHEQARCEGRISAQYQPGCRWGTEEAVTVGRAVRIVFDLKCVSFFCNFCNAPPRNRSRRDGGENDLWWRLSRVMPGDHGQGLRALARSCSARCGLRTALGLCNPLDIVTTFALSKKCTSGGPGRHSTRRKI